MLNIVREVGLGDGVNGLDTPYQPVMTTRAPTVLMNNESITCPKKRLF